MARVSQRLFFAVLVASTAIATPLSTSYNYNVERSSLTLAPLVAEYHPHGTVNNSYIIVLRDDLPESVKNTHMNFLLAAHGANPLVGDDGAGLTHVYEPHFNGYAGRFSSEVVDQLRRMPEVAYIERDQIVRTQDIQKAAPWGLARISHRKKLSFSTFTKYEYDSDGGEGVDVYVVDTGINVHHQEFEGRASWGKTIPQNDVDEDGNGHGSHCAGTIASAKYGVAKKANVIAVKVLGSNGSGSMSDVVSGVVYAAGAAKEKAEKEAKDFAVSGKRKHKGSVANMSLGGGKSQALDDVVNKAVKSGLHFAVAAGNDNRDACAYSPAAAQLAVTVGASTLGDERAYFSNYGKCVDVFGPGLNIISTYIGSNDATAVLSGTSMASPHVAGLLAYLLSVYPSKSFNPVFDPYGKLTSLHSQRTLASFDQETSMSSLYAMARDSLPSYISAYLPSQAALDVLLGHPTAQVAPIPKEPETLTPAQLKQALIALSSEDLLTDVGPGSPNLLVFNNATSS